MKFEWDAQKRLSNVRRHGIDFQDATAIFDGDVAIMTDDRFDYDEERFVTLGLLRGQIIVVVHTEREGVTRLISARKATKYERRIFFQRITD